MQTRGEADREVGLSRIISGYLGQRGVVLAPWAILPAGLCTWHSSRRALTCSAVGWVRCGRARRPV
eukprot:scaffold20763_cov116-Isochrysis_galbana.AAC.4